MIKSDLHKFDNEIYSFICQNAVTPNSNQNVNYQKKKITRMKFTPQEDDELINLVSIYGDQDWKKISDEMSKKTARTPRQCKDRYINYLSPDINKDNWTVEEDQCLILHLTFSCFQWRSLKQFFPGRSEVAIRNRFNYLHRTFMRHIKPLIANSLSQIHLLQRDGLVEIKEPNESDSNAISSLQSEQNNFLNNFNLDFNPSYLNTIQTSIFSLYHENMYSNNLTSISPTLNSNSRNANLNFDNIMNMHLSNINMISKKHILIPNTNNTIDINSLNRLNLNDNSKNMKKKIAKNVTIPQQWINAAKTIISATQTEEVKTSISEMKQKAQSLYGILENRANLAQEKRIADLFNIGSESEHYDDISWISMFGMIE